MTKDNSLADRIRAAFEDDDARALSIEEICKADFKLIVSDAIAKMYMIDEILLFKNIDPVWGTVMKEFLNSAFNTISALNTEVSVDVPKI